MSDIVVVDTVIDQVEVDDAPPDTVVVQGPAGNTGGGGSGGVTPGTPFAPPFLIPNLAAGASQSLNCPSITTALLGRLWGVDCGASVPLRFDIEIVNGSRTILTTVYKEPGNGDKWFPPDPRWYSIEGDGVSHFGITVTNLSPRVDADIRATIYYDEV